MAFEIRSIFWAISTILDSISSRFTQYIFLRDIQELNIILIWFVIRLSDNKRILKI